MGPIAIIGAGPLGSSAARRLVAAGREVLVVTRSGTVVEGAASMSLDATSREALAALPRVDAIVACCNFTYSAPAWEREWPAAIDALIDATESNEGVLVIAGNLYAEDPSNGPMSEGAPLAPRTRLGRVRARVWETALEAHRAGRVRAVEIRGSDYVGPGANAGATHSERTIGAAARGKVVRPMGDPDAPHAWTSTGDFGRLLARAATDSSMWGRAWHVPNAPAVSCRDLARMAARIAGRPEEPRVRPMPGGALRLLGLFSPVMRAVGDMEYQFRAPFLVDDSDARELLGETHTPLEESVAQQMPAR